MRDRRPLRLAAAATAIVFAATGCAQELSDRDRAALADLAAVAGPTSGVAAELVDWTECWLPSDHPVDAADAGDDTTFRVLCRVHWHQADGAARYQDTTCTGDFSLEPMLDHCYRWTYYDLMPAFEDHPGVRAG